MEKMKIRQLAAEERDELEAILRAHAKGVHAEAADLTLGSRFHSNFSEPFLFWLLLLLAAVGGAVGWFTNFRWSDVVHAAHRLPDWLGDPFNSYSLEQAAALLGLPACLAVAAWMGRMMYRNYGRRGCAATSFATVRVRGNKVALIRHADVASVKWDHHGSSGKTFSTLKLRPADGKALSVDATAAWVEVDLELMSQARAAADHPPIKPEVTWGPFYREVKVTGPNSTTSETTTTTTRIPTSEQ